MKWRFALWMMLAAVPAAAQTEEAVHAALYLTGAASPEELDDSLLEELEALQGRPDAEVQEERNALERRWLDDNPEATVRDLARWNTREGLRTLMETPLLSAFLYLQGDLGAFLPEASQLCELFGVTTGNVGTLSVLHREGLFAAARHYFGDDYGAVPWLLFASGWMFFFLLMLGQAIWVSLWRPVPWLWIFALVGFAQLAVVCLSNPRYLFPAIPLFLILILAANDDIAPARERR